MLTINTFTKSISILVIDWPGLSRSPKSTISGVNFRSMLCIFSHSWTWDQKQATWGQYQNKWSIDSVSSQQNLQSFNDFMPQIFNILLVARILYNNFSWKAQSLKYRVSSRDEIEIVASSAMLVWKDRYFEKSIIFNSSKMRHGNLHKGKKALFKQSMSFSY